MKLLCAALMAAFFMSDAVAQNIMPPGACKQRDAVEDELLQRHQEALGLRLLSKKGYVIEFYGDVDDGSWSAIKVLPNGCALPLDQGLYFRWHDALYGPVA